VTRIEPFFSFSYANNFYKKKNIFLTITHTQWVLNPQTLPSTTLLLQGEENPLKLELESSHKL